MWRRTARANLEKKPSIRLSQEPCLGVKVKSKRPGGRVSSQARVVGQPGERVIAYVDHLGRLEGHVARIIQNGFAMTISATPRKRDKLAAQLTWLANRHILGLPEDRRHGRVVPRNPITRLILPNGINVSCRIIDVSQSGAGIVSDQRRPIGALVRSAKCRAASCGISKTASRSSSPGCSTRTFLKTLSALRKQHRLTPPGNSPPAAQGSRAARPAARARNP